MKEKIKLKEKLCYGVGDVGANLVWTTVASFIAIYCTDVAGISAAVLGTILLVSRLLDGVSDVVMGTVIDRTKSKYGKARPWVLWSAPAMAVSIILLFNIPNFQEQGKNIYLLITYIFMAAFAFTASNLSYNTMLSLITTDERERNSMDSIRFEFTMSAQLVINLITIPLVNYFGGGQPGWRIVSIIYAVVTFGTLFITFAGTRERVTEEKKTEKKTENKNVIKNLKILFKNKYFVLIMIVSAVMYIMLGLNASSRIYYAKYVLQNENLFSIMTTFIYIPTVLTILFVPIVVKKVGNINTLIIGFISYTIGFLIQTIFPTQMSMIYVGMVFQGLGQSALYACHYVVVSSIVDYSDWKDHCREEGLIFSVTSFGQKVGNGLGTAGLGWLLSFGHYDGTKAVQAASAITAIKWSYLFLPLVLALVAVILFWMMRGLDKLAPVIAKDLSMRAQTTEAE